jgi:hypothetical protein
MVFSPALQFGRLFLNLLMRVTRGMYHPRFRVHLSLNLLLIVL